jgi:hypothetical protein
MTRRRWLLVIAACGAAIFALSFVSGWIVHERELRGEGYRHVVTAMSAWRGVGLPVLAIGSVGALVTAAWAALLARDPDRAGWPVVAAAAAVLGILVATAVPIGQNAHASSVDVHPGLLLLIGLLLAAVMLAGSIVVARPGRAAVAVAGVVGVLVLAGATGGRWLALQVGEGTGRHWSEGAYTRTATGGERTETLTIGDGEFAVGDRWGGTWEWSGWTVVLDGDPACPESRGTYHAHGVGDDDLRFVKVVDTCADGARAADLETGTWERDP